MNNHAAARVQIMSQARNRWLLRLLTALLAVCIPVDVLASGKAHLGAFSPTRTLVLGADTLQSIEATKGISIDEYECTSSIREFTDPDGREPNQAQAASWEQTRTFIAKNTQGAPTLQGLRPRAGDAGNQQLGPIGGRSGPRYVWTEKRGWVDMQHMLQTAALADEKFNEKFGAFAPAAKWAARNTRIGRWAMEASLWGKTVEIEGKQSQEGSSSAWNFEDPSSNLAGLDFFLDFYSGDGSLMFQLDRFFGASGARNPESAPGFSALPPTDPDQQMYKPANSMVPVMNPQRLPSGSSADEKRPTGTGMMESN